MDEENEGRGLVPIGSLTPAILNLLQSTASQTEPSSRSQMNSGTSGSRLPAETQSRQIGPRRGETALELLRRGGTNLEGVTPDQVDDSLDHSFPQCVMQCLERRETPVIDQTYGFDGVIVDYAPLGNCADQYTLAKVIARVDELNAPAQSELIVFELGRLRAMTKAKAEQQDDIKFLLMCYADDMRDYPPDVVREACRKWARTEKFFPAWSELKAELDRLVKKRRAMRFALMKLRGKS